MARCPSPGRSTCGDSGRCCGRRSSGRCSSTRQRATAPQWDLGWIRSWSNLARDREPSRSAGLDSDDFPRFSPRRSPSRCCITCGWSTSPRPRRGTPGSSRPTTSVSGSPDRASHVDLTAISAALAAGPALGLPGRPAALPALPAHGDAARRAAAGPPLNSVPSWKSRRPAADTIPRRCASSTCARFVADQRHRGARIAVPGGDAPGRHAIHGDRHHPVASCSTASANCCAMPWIPAPPTSRPGPGVHRRDARTAGRTPAGQRAALPRRSRASTSQRGQAWPTSLRTTIPRTGGCATSGRPSSSTGRRVGEVAQAAAGTASADTAGCRCSGTTRPRSATTMRRSASPNGSTTCSPHGSARPWTASPPDTATAHRRRARDHGVVPEQGPQRRQDARVTVLPVVPRPVQALGRRPRSRPLRRPPGPAHPGHEPAAPRRDPDPHPPLPGPGLRADGGALRHLSHSDLENVLQHVWVAGPGTASPGELLAGEAAPLTREQAPGPGRRPVPAQHPGRGRVCTFQPVVDGGACPWNLDCHNCDKFVLSGADLLYWRRKREQWRMLADNRHLHHDVIKHFSVSFQAATRPSAPCFPPETFLRYRPAAGFDTRRDLPGNWAR